MVLLAVGSEHSPRGELAHIALQEAIRDGATQVITDAHVGAALVD